MLGTGFASAPVTGDSVFTQGSCLTAMPGAAEADRRAFASAGIAPKDADIAEIYDCFSISCLLQFEGIGLCRKGEGAHRFRGALRCRRAAIHSHNAK